MGHVDAHSHVWTDDVNAYPLVEGYAPEELDPPRFGPEDLLRHARPVGVDRAVLIQFSAHGFDNSYILDCVRRFPGTFSAVAVVNRESERPDREMLRLASRGARGFRIRPGGAGADRWLDGEGTERMFSAASEHGLAICPLMDPEALPALARQCARFPDAPVVIDHMARIGIAGGVLEEEVASLCGMSRFPRVVVKLSAFYAFGARRPPYDDTLPLLRRLVDAFGPRRLAWGSDCPFQLAEHRYAESIAVIRDRLDHLGSEDRAWILGRTAESLFFSGP